MGDTEVRLSAKPPPNASKILFSVRPRPGTSFLGDGNCLETNAKVLCMMLSKSLQDCIVTAETIYTCEVDGIQLVCRIEQIEEDADIELNEEDIFALPDTYRGIVLPMTEIFVRQDENGSWATTPSSTSEFGPGSTGSTPWQLVNITPMPSAAPAKNLVHILTSDNEVFPVLRRLLRPCIALTSVVQAGRGIYKENSGEEPAASTSSAAVHCTDASVIEEVWVDVDACTFDRVLLYLEHEARGDQFKFDPTLAVELREAAITLGIFGLKDICDKVLGSFNERVRRTPIRLSEVIARNTAGGDTAAGAVVGNPGNHLAAVTSSSSSTAAGSSGAMTNNDRKKTNRSETLLLISGMVFDITRWLDEHPGGSHIIPEQALNVDATVFFEIYHASKQSFLYLREFYIGELAEEDVPQVPMPRGGLGAGEASGAFREQLERMTPWRLKKEDLVVRTVRNL